MTEHDNTQPVILTDDDRTALWNVANDGLHDAEKGSVHNGGVWVGLIDNTDGGFPTLPVGAYAIATNTYGQREEHWFPRREAADMWFDNVEVEEDGDDYYLPLNHAFTGPSAGLVADGANPDECGECGNMRPAHRHQCVVCGKPVMTGESYLVHSRLAVAIHADCPRDNVMGEDVSTHTMLWSVEQR